MIGTTVSHYKVLEKLGEGGMGVVYKAQDLKLDRTVALKFLPAQSLSDEEAKKRFIHEAKAASSLDHPNICNIHEIDETPDGQTFIAMAIYEGAPLNKKIEKGPLKIEEAIDIAIQVAEGLQAAHEKGIVHRDIKASNIVITGKGRAVIMDFGLAKTNAITKLTKTGSTLGTYPYMSPEQARGENIDHRTDIWSLGVLLYEMITGLLPFRSEYQEAVVYAILNENPASLASIRNDVSPIVDQIVRKCLEKEARDRYQTCDEIIAVLIKLRQTKRLNGRRRILRVFSSKQIAISVVAAVIVVGLVLTLSPLGFKPPSSEPSTKKTLAVMYFDNIADREDKAQLGEMLTTLLITSISQSDAVEVISRERILELQNEIAEGSSKAIPASLATRVAKRSGASFMLVGNIVQANPIALTSQLIDVESGNLIAARNLKGFSTEDLFTLVDTMAFHVVSSLEVNRKSLEKIRPVTELTTKSLEAYLAYTQAEELMQRQYIRDGLEAYKRATELDTSFAMPYAAYASNDPLSTRGKEAMRRAWKLRGNVSEYERLIIEARYANIIESDPLKSSEIWEEVAQKYPHTQNVYFQLARRYARMGEIEKSRHVLLRGVRIDSLSRVTWNALAYDYAALGRRDTAFLAVRQALLVRPADPDPYDSYGDMYAYFGDLDSAAIFFAKAKSIRPDYVSTHKLGCIQLLRRDYEGARSNFVPLAVEIGPDDGYFGSAMIPLHQGRLLQARKQAESNLSNTRLTKLNADMARSRLLVIITSYELRDFRRMLAFTTAEHLQLLLRDLHTGFYLPEDFVTTLDDLPLDSEEAWALAAAGKEQEALVAFQRIFNGIKVKHKSAQAKHSFNLGMVAFHSKNYTQAVEHFQRASDLLPPNRYAFYFYGVSLLKSGKLREAIAELRLATWKYPYISGTLYFPSFPYWPISVVKAHYWLGVAYEQQGEREKAVKEYEVFLETWKDADFDSPELKDAKVRLAALKKNQ